MVPVRDCRCTHISPDYALASNDQRSTSDVAGMLSDTGIGWKSSTQKGVTTATYESEYVALCDGLKEAFPQRSFVEWHAIWR